MRITIRRPSDPGDRREVPVYQQVIDQIEAHVRAGDLEPGERLPTIRALAQQLGVHRDTISQAYEALARAGLIESTVGRGSFVRRDVHARPSASRRSTPPALSARALRLLDFERSRPRYAPGNGAAPLHSLVPDPSLYPVDEFRRCLDRVLARSGSELLAYGEPQGHATLRQVISERLAGHGVDAAVDEVVISHGVSQGISLALRLFADPGDKIAVEEPTYHNLLQVLVALGLQPVPVAMTPDGPDLDALERALARADVKAFYSMPSFHNPLGTTSNLEQRRALLDVAARHSKPVIEDSFEMDLRYAGKRVPPLAALDPNGLVVHLFSFSKSLFPGVRVGSVVARGRAIQGLLALKNTTDLTGSTALQAAVAEFVGSGGYDRHLERLRGTLRDRCEVLLAALADAMPEGTRWTEPEGGYQVWVELPPEIDTAELLSEASRAGVVFAPGYQFHHDRRPSSCLRLTLALADRDEIRRGVAALGEVVHRRLAAGPRAARENEVYV